MSITLIKYAVIMAMCFSGGFGAAWKWQSANIAEIKLEVSHADTQRAQESFRQIELDSAKKSSAQTNKVKRDASLLVDSSMAVSAGNGLRIASEDTVRSAKESLSACTTSVAIYDKLLGEVVEAGGRMAAEADAWESDAIAQHEAAQ